MSRLSERFAREDAELGEMMAAIRSDPRYMRYELKTMGQVWGVEHAAERVSRMTDAEVVAVRYALREEMSA